MSFAGQTKKELTMVDESACCQRAEVEAIVGWNGLFRMAEDRRVLDVETENVATARRIYTLIKAQFDVHPEVVVRKKMRLKKNNIYAIRVPSVHAEAMLRSLGWEAGAQTGPVGPAPTRTLKACCKRAFLRGAFLAAGSVNDPGGTSYHLEIGCPTESQANHALCLMNEFGLHAKLIQRKKGYVVYLKEGEKIVEFLSIIGAHQALLKFEDVRILKGMRNQVNRLVNCETANMNKTIAAAVRQLEVIRWIDQQIGLETLPPHLREAAELRLRHPEVNLQELSQRTGNRVSKSGLNHRFRKLEEIANKLRMGVEGFSQ
ncbi:DNA-binding protein WhiA [Alicyclobacillus cycloheptanicus]|uniref:Probable cell division protein WhiA n=1 Tax=Alicyclobacillus cycloheptanicus TaxID=1457 RepID=A0ABT9XM24_9BACL|nr:DNA-binding protein WhiA [Alicyclobacillus cycloheptanicus]MDQ0191365.1 DNA-binding protein WhiA [Alicyclobacillus cycloheptanicus]WDL99844.1 DNA-binding protein WhiA [Alicyclobacillus cycloheptanicus]